MDAKCTCIDGKQTGQRILDYMQKQGLSVNGLARMLEVTPNAVRNYIRGHNRPFVEKMYLLQNLLGGYQRYHRGTQAGGENCSFRGRSQNEHTIRRSKWEHTMKFTA